MTGKRRSEAITIEDSEDELAVSQPELSLKRPRRTLDEATSARELLTPSTPQSTRPGRQRQSTTSPSSALQDVDFLSESEVPERDVEPAKVIRREFAGVALSGPAYPRSAYHGWQTPSEPMLEALAITKLRTAFASKYAEVQEDEKPDYTFFRLDDFSIYRGDKSNNHDGELVSLHLLSRDFYGEFLFDGTLSVGDEKFYVQGVPFRILSVDGYGEVESTDLGSQLCIQSRIGGKGQQDIWYQLGRPAQEYKRFYQPFLWLARFTKHFVDYLLEHEKVSLMHFHGLFLEWLRDQYDEETTFREWLAIAGLEDFRGLVAANVGYLRKECYGVDPGKLLRHPLWGEVNPHRLAAIPEQPNLEPKTVVTPYAYECFSAMYFGDQLAKREVSTAVLRRVIKRKQRLRLTPRHIAQHESNAICSLLTPASMARDSPEPPLDVSAGDVVCVHPDISTKWGADGSPWFVYVQQVRAHGDRTLLDVLWLYEPKDTTMGKAYYPFKNELFMSDNCSCGREALDLECAIEKLDVSWFPQDPYAEKGLFVRQKFRTIHQEDTYDFVALHNDDFVCKCEDRVPIFEECRSKYAIGDTVLVREWSSDRGEDRLQPAQIVHFDTAKRRIQLRRLDRRSEIEPESNAPPNELVLSPELYDKSCDKIIRKCHVRFFGDERDVVAPYDRGGLGDFYYIGFDEPETTISNTLPLPDESGELVYDAHDSLLPRINQGWHPKTQPRKGKLKGMGIFCGGGTFDRGLEEGGSVDFHYAVDWAEHALHSHRANVLKPETVKYFLGSVDDCLANAMKGNKNVAGPGQVELISAGSPCPGFSRLQMDQLSDKSRRNASMVASVVAYVDFYVPEYFVLENVVSMTSGMGRDKTENVFSQIIAALVGLGYQVQQFLMDAWSYGSSQQRSRVFIVASAPGLPPLNQPQHSHGHPPNAFQGRALGKSSNGLSFGIRKNCFAPFEHITPKQACSDLPNIDDAQVQLCLTFPDHRTAINEPAANRTRMAVVPTRPHGMGLMQAKLKGLLRGEPSEHCDQVGRVRSLPTSTMYARVYPKYLFPTIVTRLTVGDGINGRCLHWEQPRALTVMEARRAQGYLDHEVLIGTAVQQLSIVGNSVDRKVALMLGLLLRESWMGVDTAAAAGHDALDDRADFADLEDEDSGQDEEQDYAGFNAEEEMGESQSPAAGSSGNHQEVSRATDVEDMNIDNRSAKIALQLSAEEIEEVKRDHFRAIGRILDARAQ
ncbi:DNA (cytosine-5)-methyltransferase 3 [Fulvia fulva]|nr:DNA (cytosine-5)-methyltransferase 3 [Fulvia fulva]KAK4614347.1 DNA (cytosine-5)-methyltransferase 3 [Fulvia fulva]WPV19794.1 DNA (cytosine-5)-methyltransferase 3 [Fulvia fulva]WPV34985.1 DNA (cytosine-5)-methyltransferase 3 [Fulvia fulva]